MSKILGSPAEMTKTKDYLICIDSDGCVFDSMEVKHKECFIPNIIEYWDLEAISKYAREASEYVNLYSKYRGTNRFPALIMMFDLLAEWGDVLKRGYRSLDISSLRTWVANEKKLGNPALIAHAKANPNDEVIQRTLHWSIAVNEAVERIVRFVPPFPFVIDTFEKIKDKADIIVVSGTPSEALAREWELHNIDKYVQVIAGQEAGSKKDCIAAAIKKGYSAEKVIMIGDAPGDHEAADANNAMFYPINPGTEDASWERLYLEALDKYFEGTYIGEYQNKVLKEFDNVLPSVPRWKR